MYKVGLKTHNRSSSRISFDPSWKIYCDQRLSQSQWRYKNQNFTRNVLLYSPLRTHFRNKIDCRTPEHGTPKQLNVLS